MKNILSSGANQKGGGGRVSLAPFLKISGFGGITINFFIIFKFQNKQLSLFTVLTYFFFSWKNIIWTGQVIVRTQCTLLYFTLEQTILTLSSIHIRAGKKSSFLNGQSTKAFSPPSRLSGQPLYPPPTLSELFLRLPLHTRIVMQYIYMLLYCIYET